MEAPRQNESPEAKTMAAITQNESQEAKTMRAITQNEPPEAKTMGAIAQNEAPEAIWTKLHGNGFPEAICTFSQKIRNYCVIFPHQNVVNFNTKLITFWPIA